MTLRMLLAHALNLPAADRARLIGHLIASLDADGAKIEQAAWEPSWAAEVNRRTEALRVGQTKTTPADAVFARLRERAESKAG